MSLARLATVELQLIMHHLNLQSLLALARCCRSTLAAASNAFSWKCIGVVPFESTISNLAARLTASRLLRHVDVSVGYSHIPPVGTIVPARTRELALGRGLSIDRLDVFRIRENIIMGNGWLPLLTASPDACAYVQALTVDSVRISAKTLTLLMSHFRQVRTVCYIDVLFIHNDEYVAGAVHVANTHLQSLDFLNCLIVHNYQFISISPAFLVAMSVPSLVTLTADMKGLTMKFMRIGEVEEVGIVVDVTSIARQKLQECCPLLQLEHVCLQPLSAATYCYLGSGYWGDDEDA
jgi:hypothetical protein